MGSTGPLGRLVITKFPSEGVLESRGNGLWKGEGGEEVPAEEVRLKSGGVEGSNVQPIIETTTLIDILRSYQNSAKMSVDLGDMRQRAIDKLGRVS